MADIKIITPTVKRIPARARGPLSSEEYNDFQDQVYFDITNLSESVNSLYASQLRSMRTFESELINIKRRIDALDQITDYKEFTNGKTQSNVDRYIDFHDSSNVIYLDSIAANKQAELKSQFGEIYLPANGVENKFFNFSLRTNQIVMPPDFSVDVVSRFDKGDGTGIKDYEYGGIVDPGSPENAFNGINETYWQRMVTLPLESTVEQVEVQLTAIVPAGISAQANLLEVVPFPEGTTDIVSISTSPNLTSAFTLLDTFAEINNASATRYHFTPRDVEQVRIRLRCRHWRELNGKKVFLYGLQELGLKLVDYNKTISTDSAFGDSITAIVKLNAPEGHTFKNLFRVDPRPNFYLEDASNRHIRLRLSTSPNFLNVKWDSAQNILPQQGISTGVSLGNSSTLYAIYTLKYVASSGGYQSPFPVGTTPTIKGLGLLFSTTPTNGL